MRISDWSSDVCSSDLFDEIYQTQRFDRYKAVVQQMLDAGTAYYCYASKEELDAMRAEQMARKEKPSYDGRWRPEAAKTLPPPPPGGQPVVRFPHPASRQVVPKLTINGNLLLTNNELQTL